MLGGHEGVDVALGDVEVGLGQGHLDIGQEGLEEAEVLDHLVEHLAVSGLPGRPQAAAHSVPAGDDLTGLSPAEDPRDRPQVVDPAHPSGSSRGAASQVELAQFLHRGRCKEVRDQAGVLDQVPVCGVGFGGEAVHDLGPAVQRLLAPT